LNNGRIFITGGCRDLDTDNPGKRPCSPKFRPGPAAGVDLLLLGD
jgi:hypothetical protein